MANSEHLTKLTECLQLGKEDITIWNQWRKEHSDIRPDLSKAHLDSAHLDGANFGGAYLDGAHLDGANFGGAYLSEANLTRANLSRASLTRANLRGANFRGAFLYGADLSGVDLSEADLSGTYLHETNFTDAICENTTFANVDMHTVKGLETIQHDGPSTIGIDTIYRSGGTIPEAFLKGAGVDDTFIAYIRSLTGTPINYYSCFISYSSQDQAFAEHLFADLQSKNVRCWFAPHHMKIGDKIRPRIDESIRVYEKLLLILSKDSIESTWVAYEVEKALNKEPKGIPNVLFPIRIDDTILTCSTHWAQDIKSTRHIGDFTHWKGHDTYQFAFTRLLRDLKAQSQ